MTSRRRFLSLCAAGIGVLIPARAAWASHRRPDRRGPHPDPRPGITARDVLTREQLAGSEDVLDVFDKVREIPEIVDGIRCQCGCADSPGFYSLLSCYESEGMARYCDICQGEGRLAYRLHRSGKSLEEIRAAIDARYS